MIERYLGFNKIQYDFKWKQCSCLRKDMYNIWASVKPNIKSIKLSSLLFASLKQVITGTDVIRDNEDDNVTQVYILIKFSGFLKYLSSCEYLVTC